MKKTTIILTTLASLLLAASAFAADAVTCQDMVAQWTGNLDTVTDVRLGISNAGSQSIIPNVSFIYNDEGSQGETSLTGSCNPLSDGSGVQMVATQGPGSVTITLKNDTPTIANVSAHICETMQYCINANGSLNKS